MTFADLIACYGDSNAEIAKRLGVSRQIVAHWRHAGITEQRQAWIQQQTRGKLKAERRNGARR